MDSVGFHGKPRKKTLKKDVERADGESSSENDLQIGGFPHHVDDGCQLMQLLHNDLEQGSDSCGFKNRVPHSSPFLVMMFIQLWPFLQWPYEAVLEGESRPSASASERQLKSKYPHNFIKPNPSNSLT